ncbi:hypothetical protein ACIPYS_06515 [Kitasatospora sp. NPDC089913]|uniref:hypothetical protein n=1 Tax=Kitasatospora sp. NPDC089913 TaxID=3364080 RepID=UPI0037F5B0A4
MAHSKRLAWATALLALAFPAATKAVLAFAAAVVAVLLAHPQTACSLAAGVLLASTLPALRRRLHRARIRRAERGLVSAVRLDLAGGTR